ncbi:hypothetical protein CR194_15300 [Salipaludibacillus keqinensis]|uniref:Uncharacterized protein n=1 Tax=Salipaludibacillus keqinensis TaxID=2045207 RepID=A0A323TBJ0_9BACI|nr:hypothetical protein [Salipaludibacillus keqinensis]PYZ92206.1 hypothetical protein CR194_15300 [Salipaludibacillus keqinensis]
MWTFIIIVSVILVLFAIYFMNIGLIRVQLEELAHRHQKGDSQSGDLEEWEYYLGKLFWKPVGTKKAILTYGAHYEDYLTSNYPNYDSSLVSKYKKLKHKEES